LFVRVKAPGGRIIKIEMAMDNSYTNESSENNISDARYDRDKLYLSGEKLKIALQV